MTNRNLHSARLAAAPDTSVIQQPLKGSLGKLPRPTG